MPTPKRLIDLRSDTVTRPSEGMRQAMARAEVGDDVFGEDPTVRALQEKAAALLKREAALFVPSGTMANQIAIKLLTRAGDELLVESGTHALVYESGAAALFSSVQLRTLQGRRGLLSPNQIEAEVRPHDPHFAPTRGVCLENTHNRGGGSVYPLELMAEIRATALRLNLVVHLDGARLFNACAATGHAPSDYARLADTVSFCLSKGLGAPVGSMLVGDANAIQEAVRWRKALGGGMRQSGILAAAGLYALNHHVDRLSEDHENARVLAQGISGIKGLEIDPEQVESNIVLFRMAGNGLSAQEYIDRLKDEGVLMLPFSPTTIRAVTHLDVSRSDIIKAVEVMAAAMKDR